MASISYKFNKIHNNETCDISIGSTSQSQDEKKNNRNSISISIEGINQIIEFLLYHKCINCEYDGFCVLNKQCNKCKSYGDHSETYRKFLKLTFHFVSKHKKCCVYQLNTLIRKINKMIINKKIIQDKTDSIDGKLFIDLKYNVLSCVLKKLLRISKIEGIVDIEREIDKCHRALFSSNTMNWCNINSADINRHVMKMNNVEYTYDSMNILPGGECIFKFNLKLITNDRIKVSFVPHRYMINKSNIIYDKYVIIDKNSTVNRIVIKMIQTCIDINKDALIELEKRIIGYKT